MNRNELEELEGLLSILQNDSKIISDNLELFKLEKEALDELDLNEDKINLLLEDPNEENISAILDYFENLNKIVC